MKARLIFLLIVGVICYVEYLNYYLEKGYGLLIACMVLIAVNVFYMSIAKLRYKERKTPYAKNFKPFVSIVIPAKNEEKVITETVKNMMSIVYHNSDGKPNYELIVVDDASSDKTLEILQQLHEEEYPNLVPYHREPVEYPSKAGVLNEIHNTCKGDIIAIFDADARVSPVFLERIIPYLHDEKVGAVQAQKTISNEEFNELTSAQADEMIMLMSIGENQDLAEGAVDLRGNGMILKKKAIEDVGGWNEKALTEDLDMSSRLHIKNWNIRYCPDIAVLEEGVTSIKALYKQRKRWAEGGLRRYLDYLPYFFENDAPPIKKMDMFAFFLSFYFPIWFFIGIIFSIVGTIQSGDLKIAVVVYFFILIAFVMTINTYIGLSKSGIKKKRALLYRSIRSVIFNSHWLIVMPIVSFKILFSFKQSKWVKTERQGDS